MASLVTSPKFRAWVPSTGALASGYKLQTFAGGTTTPLVTYSDSGLTVPNTNPIVLDANGEAVIYAAAGTIYKLQFQDTSGTPLWTVDQVTVPSGAGGGAGASTSEWVIDAAVPTYISGTSFSLPTDRTGTYHVNRRIRTLNTAGLIYSTIASASFGGGITTITVVNDTGMLDSGLSQISYGILDSINTSYPANIGGGSTSGGGSGNILYNGGFDIWQRGAGGSASFTGIASRTYTADRWQAQHTGGNATVTQVAGAVSRYGLKLQRTAGNAITAGVQVAQSLEINDCIRFGLSGSSFTLSFNIKAGANLSSSSNNVLCQIIAGKDASDTSLLAGYATASNVGSSTIGITTTSVRYSLSGTLPAGQGYTEFGVLFQFNPTGTAGADDSITIENVQLEANPSATTFKFLSFATNLAQCQRYFEKSFNYPSAPAQNVGNVNGPPLSWCAGKAGATAENPGMAFFHVQKRNSGSTTVTLYNPSAANSNTRDSTANVDCTSVSNVINDNGLLVYVTGNASTAVGSNLQVHWAVDADIQ